MNWPRLTTVTDAGSFLGFTNHYRRFIHNFVHIARPLNVLISGENANKKKQTIKWNDDCEKSFQELKQLFNSVTILAYADYSKPFKLCTDASNLGLGAVLYQTDEDDLERVIAYASRTLSKSERNYTTYRLEFLTLKWAITCVHLHMRRMPLLFLLKIFVYLYIYILFYDNFMDNLPINISGII